MNREQLIARIELLLDYRTNQVIKYHRSNDDKHFQEIILINKELFDILNLDTKNYRNQDGE